MHYFHKTTMLLVFSVKTIQISNFQACFKKNNLFDKSVVKVIVTRMCRLIKQTGKSDRSLKRMERSVLHAMLRIFRNSRCVFYCFLIEIKQLK